MSKVKIHRVCIDSLLGTIGIERFELVIKL
jgi:hypothetical protein